VIIRSFRNTDPPTVARLWNRLPSIRGRARDVTASALEAIVFSKPYFDPAGFLVAEENDELLGFCHAGFGPNEDQTALCRELGVTCMVVTDPQRPTAGLAKELLAASETYLRQNGAKVLYGGQVAPLNPFYLGMYGGSEHPGILESDLDALTLFREAGYEEVDRVLVMQIALPAPSIVDRKQLLVKRRFRVERVESEGAPTWWAVCTAPYHDEVYFHVFANNGGPSVGGLRCWLIEPLTHTWANVTVGLTNVWIDSNFRRQGLGTFLTSDSLRQLAANGIQRAEVQIMQRNTAAMGLYQKLGFRVVEQGVVFRKPALT
jgi:ribosomal protein S18 acetylase RimI-like enzyme